MKKVFTLMELLVVIIIIGFVMLISLRLGWDYIVQMQFRSDAEDFVGFWDKTVSQNLSSSYYRTKKYDSMYIDISDQLSNYRLYLVDSQGETPFFQKKLNVGYFSGFNNQLKIQMKSGELGCKALFSTGEMLSGTVSLGINSHRSPYSYCYDIQLNSCKLLSKRCKQ